MKQIPYDWLLLIFIGGIFTSIIVLDRLFDWYIGDSFLAAFLIIFLSMTTIVFTYHQSKKRTILNSFQTITGYVDEEDILLARRDVYDLSMQLPVIMKHYANTKYEQLNESCWKVAVAYNRICFLMKQDKNLQNQILEFHGVTMVKMYIIMHGLMRHWTVKRGRSASPYFREMSIFLWKNLPKKRELVISNLLTSQKLIHIATCIATDADKKECIEIGEIKKIKITNIEEWGKVIFSDYTEKMISSDIKHNQIKIDSSKKELDEKELDEEIKKYQKKYDVQGFIQQSEKYAARIIQGTDSDSYKLKNRAPTMKHFERKDLANANFEGMNFEGISLKHSVLEGSNLRNVNFRRVNLRRADLESVDLRGANLGGADLEGVNLRGADLEGADLEGVKNMEKATLEKTNLKNVKNLPIKYEVAEKKGAINIPPDN